MCIFNIYKNKNHYCPIESLGSFLMSSQSMTSENLFSLLLGIEKASRL